MKIWNIHGLLLQRMGMQVFVLALLVFMMVSTTAAGRLYTLTPPPYYTVFSGDLDFNYTMPGNVSLPNAFVRLEFWPKGSESPVVITTMGLRLGRKSGSLRVTCGVIEFAGEYTLKMYTSVKGRVLVEAALDVRWPEVGLSLPDYQDAQTTSVEVRIISNANCSSLLHRNYFQIKVLFQRTDLGGAILKLPNADEIYVTNFTAIRKPFSTLELGCYLFDLDGFYQVILVSSPQDSPLVSSSNIMTVRWSHGYYLSTSVQSAFPCEDSITLVYTHPPCSGRDKIRLYSFTRMAEGSPASPLERTYITEVEADPDKIRMPFDCRLFNQSAVGFCFIYVSISRGDVVSEQKKLCLPAQADSVFPIDGGWSKWTAWTSCSVTCGAGKKSRFRMCNEPAPKHGGRFCDGDPVEWMPCQVHCPESIPITPLHSPSIDPSCVCGCTETSESGRIIATGRCHDLSTWIVQAGEGHVVAIGFDYFNLNYTRQWVKIRDGRSPSDTLLFSSINPGYPMEIVTSGPAMRVEFMTKYIIPPPAAIFPKNATLPIHAHGFIASYEIRASVVSSTAPALFQYEEETIMDSTVTIVGIVICVVVIIVAIVFVILQRTYFQRRVKYSIATSGESPAHQMTTSASEPHGSSAHSSSPSSPGNAIHVDMEVPLTGKTQRKGSGGKTSRTSSVSSTRSGKVKKLKSRGDSASSGKGKANSPKPASRDYTPVTSPYGIEVIDIDETGGNDASSKVKTPRSPCVISSNHKHSPHTPASPITKLDMLNKKRKERSGKGVTADLDREVTGSSGSRTPSTTKAEVNWSQSGFVRTALNEVGRSFTERNKRSGQRPPSEEIPLIDSMTSSQESQCLINSLVKSDSQDSATTSFLHPVTSKARRPTSLTESYSVDSLPQKSKPKTEQSAQETAEAQKGKVPTCDSTSKPVQLPLSAALSSSSSTVNKTKQPSSSSSLLSKQKLPEKASSSRTSLASNKSSDKLKKTAYEERQTLLPKPDGQSPRIQRHESPGATGASAKGPVSPGKVSKTSSKNTISSPARSIPTPSEIEGLELEYDDFVEDDPLSYFDYEETQKLAFRGVEKIGKTPVEEEEDEDEV